MTALTRCSALLVGPDRALEHESIAQAKAVSEHGDACHERHWVVDKMADKLPKQPELASVAPISPAATSQWSWRLPSALAPDGYAAHPTNTRHHHSHLPKFRRSRPSSGADGRETRAEGRLGPGRC
jgi:hypothetical protein